MKPVTVCILLICMVVCGPGGNAFAAEDNVSSAQNAVQTSLAPGSQGQESSGRSHFGKNWTVMLGLKIWPNKWDLPVELFGYDNKTYIHEFESGAELTYIPAVLIRYRNFFIGGSYLSETDYDFVNQNYSNWGVEDNILYITGTTISVSGSRKEWDLNLGYFLLPNLAISIGYKNLDRDLDIFFISEGYSSDGSQTDEIIDDVFEASYPLSAYAPIVGLSASTPLVNRLNLYGNMAYGLLDGDAEYNYEGGKNELTLDGEYVFAELGLSYTILLKRKSASAVTFNIGYRFQRLEMQFESKDGGWGHSGDQHDSTAGLIVGVCGSL